MRILTFDLFEATKDAGPKPLTKAQQEFLDRYTKGTWTWNPETGVVDIKGDFDIHNRGFKSFKGVRFGKVSGFFSCRKNGLTSLEGAPEKVGGSFNCMANLLTSLSGAPKEVGKGFDCSSNDLASLEGAPREVGGNFDCRNNLLTSLSGAPKEVGGDFRCSFNLLTSLEGAPEEVGGAFYCFKNKLTSLSGAPKEVGKGFDCSSNDLASLEGAPREVGGTFDCAINQLTSLSGAPKEVENHFDCRNNLLTTLVGAPKKIGGQFLSDPFDLKDWSIAGFLDLLNGKGKIYNPDATKALILPLLDEPTLDNYFKQNPLDLDLLDELPDIKKGVLARTGLKDTGSVSSLLRRGFF